MATKASIINKAARAYTKLAPKYMPGVRCFLLKRTGNSGSFTLIAELVNSRWARFSEYRGQYQFQYATNDESFKDKFAQMTHIAFGVPDADNQIEVFVKDPTQNDVISPVGSNLIWKAYVSKVETERYTVT